MAAMDTTYGSLLLGLVLSAALYGVTVLQTFLYFRKYPRDRGITKALVVILWSLLLSFLTAASPRLTGGLQAIGYFPFDSVHYRGILVPRHELLQYRRCSQADMEHGGARPVFRYFACSTSDSECAVVSQLQTDCNLLRTSIVDFVKECTSNGNHCGPACIHFGAYGLLDVPLDFSLIWHNAAGLGIVFTVESFQLTSMMKFDHLIWVVGAGIGSAAAADLMIAGSLCYYLSRTRTGFHRTDSLITLLIIYSLTTGLVTSLLDVIIVITFSLMPNNWVWLSVFWICGKCYVNSLLAALNSRESLREKVTHPQGSNFIQFTPVGNTSARHHRSDFTIPTPLTVSIQRDTVFRTDYSNASLPSAISSPVSPVKGSRSDHDFKEDL
ncbi:hypothetical protein D9758_002559 [Tetrapyrgos nigripes]|uniref:DUF6534 domain-containing protein n=1 Tax=Tetrapyrgos nigripes TaxID=182062 RepID=A0A8H5GQS2_9AGAR|nr:hypothetical protein D9758_002559 [Tetrapyrgos nigripes]